MVSMSSENLKSLMNNSPTIKIIIQNLEKFRWARNRIFRRIFRILPGLPFLVIAIAAIRSLADPMFISGMVAAALSLIAFNLLMGCIPDALCALLNRDMIAVSHDSEKIDGEVAQPATSSSRSVPAPAPEDLYLEFIRDFERMLNSPRQWFVAIFFAFLGFVRFPYITGGLGAFIAQPRSVYLEVVFGSEPLTPEILRSFYLFVLGPILESFIGFIIGLMAWRMLVTGFKVWRLGKDLELRPRPNHPDGCGGFEPLGNLCLWHALIISIPAIYLGGWVILGQHTGYGHSYVPLHSALLIIPIASAFVSFFLPLWSIHVEMIAQRDAAWIRLERLGEKIGRLELEMIDHMDSMRDEDVLMIEKQLALMRLRYQQHQSQNEGYPVWPFNIEVLAKFLTSQLVPFVGLAKGALDFIGIKPL
ncbi:MAG: hypothetical protein ACP5EL_06095 [Methanocrinis sp.]